MGWIIFFGACLLIIIFSYVSSIYSTIDNLEQENENLVNINSELVDEVNNWRKNSQLLEEQERRIETDKNNADNFLIEKEKRLNQKEELFNKLFKERTKNYPLIGQIWAELINVTETERQRALYYKKNPALKAAEEISAIKKEKKELVKELVYWKYKSQNYEAIYPWLEEELKQDIETEVEANIYYSVYTEKERQDPVSQYISPEDYRKLSISKRNQLALDRYWKRGKRTKWMIGKMYERYVGYLYESDGWDVEYFGIHKRFEDLGRDLIATKGNQVHVVQCKNWSKFKTIYENHIFQLFGTSYGLQKEKPGKIVTPVFYCTTSLSDTAQEFAKRLGISIKQTEHVKEYPCIKCNISSNGEKIYHLPFDQQYDTIKITPKTGEFFASTISEAEKNGFRRAFKWSGAKS